MRPCSYFFTLLNNFNNVLVMKPRLFYSVRLLDIESSWVASLSSDLCCHLSRSRALTLGLACRYYSSITMVWNPFWRSICILMQLYFLNSFLWLVGMKIKDMNWENTVALKCEYSFRKDFNPLCAQHSNPQPTQFQQRFDLSDEPFRW